MVIFPNIVMNLNGNLSVKYINSPYEVEKEYFRISIIVPLLQIQIDPSILPKSS